MSFHPLYIANLKPARIFLFAASILLLHSACKDNKEGSNHQFEKSGAVVLNPGQGWILYGSPSEQSAATIALATTGYGRYDWSTLNPQENVYNWSSIDNEISLWAARGKQYAFGVMNVNTSGNNVYCTPKWVFDKGAKYTMGNGEGSSERKYYIPVWDDPVYVAECKKFAEALAKKYDNNPNIAFIDIRNYGNWGEMHMYPFENYTKTITNVQLQSLLIQPYIDNFKNIQLIVCWVEPPLTASNQWVVDNGIGLRNDGIMGNQSNSGHSGNGDVIKMAIGKQPIVWEFLGPFRSFVGSKPWNDDRFKDNIKNYKPSYIGMGHWNGDAQYMLTQKPNLVKEAANLMGYNFSMMSANYPEEVSAGETMNISLSIENSGVTNMLTDCVIKIALIDDSDRVVSSFATDWNAKTIQGGATSNFTANAVIKDVPAGTYHLALGLYRNANDPKPTYNLDNKGRTADGFYLIGTIKII